MNLNSNLVAHLQHAADHQADYKPSAEVVSQIKNISLGMVIAPTAMGKTYVMNRAVELNPEFSRVSVFTTRKPRPDDMGMFRYYSQTEDDLRLLLSKIDHQELVQYAVFPHTGQIYGSEPSDFATAYTLLATLANSVAQLRHVGLKQCVPIGLVADPNVWVEWFEKRYAERADERQSRLQEARESIAWLLTHEVSWLINEPENVDDTAQRLVRIVKNGEATDQARAVTYAEQLHTQISQMIQ